MFLSVLHFQKLYFASLSTCNTIVRVNLVNGSSGQGNGLIGVFSFLILQLLFSVAQSFAAVPA
jgi:hypothetical protein